MHLHTDQQLVHVHMWSLLWNAYVLHLLPTLVD